MMKNFNKRQLGRDSTKGMLSFRTGVIPNLKDRERNRKSKAARKQLRDQLRGE